MRLENPFYHHHTHPIDVDTQDATAVYSVLRGSESHSEEQPQYEAINKPKELRVSPERPPHQMENLNASPNEEPEGGLLVYAQPDLSKKKKAHPSIASTSDESPPPIPPHIDSYQ